MFSESMALAVRSLRKWVRNPFAVIVGAIQGIFWLALFGNTFNPANSLPSASGGSLGLLQSAFGGASNYITYIAPGVIALVALTTMSFMGVDMVLDRINGYVDVLGTYPIPRTSIYFGGVFQNIAKAMVLAVITFALALVVPNGMELTPGFGAADLLGIMAALALLALVFSTVFTAMAVSVKTVDSFFAMVNFLAFPILFTSTALFPLSFFPAWLKAVAQVNPVSLASDAVRLLLVHGVLSNAQWTVFMEDIIGLSAFAVACVVAGTILARHALRPT